MKISEGGSIKTTLLNCLHCSESTLVPDNTDVPLACPKCGKMRTVCFVGAGGAGGGGIGSVPSEHYGSGGSAIKHG